MQTKTANIAPASYPCPDCGLARARQGTRLKNPKDLNGVVWRVTVGNYFCPACNRRYSSVDPRFPPCKNFTKTVIDLAIGYYSGGDSYKAVTLKMEARHKVKISINSVHGWVTDDRYARMKDDGSKVKPPAISDGDIKDAFGGEK